MHTLPTRLKNLESKPVYALIWTTTPWSLAANQAIVFSSDIEYCIVEDNSKNVYILAQQCLASIEQKMGTLKLISTIKGNKLHIFILYVKKRVVSIHIVIMRNNLLIGKELSEATYLHPITKEHLPFLPGQHVTTDIGTGLVHTAPAHGPEDFLIAIQNNIPVVSH